MTNPCIVPSRVDDAKLHMQKLTATLHQGRQSVLDNFSIIIHVDILLVCIIILKKIYALQI
jgi:hypothetical protein